MAFLSRSIILHLVLIYFLNLSSALYEDQVGKFDWKRSFIGKVKYAELESKKLIVVTEENILAALNVKNGEIMWRQLLENPSDHDVKLLHIDRDVFTISGSLNNWIVRTWDINSGTLLTERALVTEKLPPFEFLVLDGKLIHAVPIVGSYLEISSYHLLSGDPTGKTVKIPAPWITDLSNCVITRTYYVCILNNDYSGQIYYVDFISKDRKVHSKPIQSLVNAAVDKVKISALTSKTPAFILDTNDGSKLIHIEKDDLVAKPFDIMINAVCVRNEGKLVVHQLEASDNPGKLIKVVSKDYSTGEELSAVDLDYPLGLGAPVIVASLSKGAVTDLLLSTSDNAIVFMKLPEGKVKWTREEALSHIVATEFLELPVSELDASIENEFKTSSNNVLNMLAHRLTTQAKQLSNIILGGQLLSGSGLVRDEFGLHKIIVVATKAGKLFAIDTLTGSIAWTYRLPNVKPFTTLQEEKMLLFVQRTARYAPLPAQCILLAEDSTTGNGILFEFDPITGYSRNGIVQLNQGISQAVLLPHEDEYHIKPILLVSPRNEVSIHPSSAKSLITKHITQTYIYLVDTVENSLKGFSFHHSTGNSLLLTPTWQVSLPSSKIVAIGAKHPNERVHSQGRVLPDRSVYYKYVNPNLVAIATLADDPVHKRVLSIYLIDGVSGLILYSTSHKRAKGPVHLVHSENWLVYSYFSERFRRTEVVAAELYEGHVQSNSTVFSSHAVSLLPHIQTQSYILPANPLKLAVTLTERGITNKFLLMALSGGSVSEIPWLLLQPRFNDIPCGPEESCIPYMPEIPLPGEAVINYNQSIGRIRGIEVAPARLESTSHVLVHGLDIFYTRVAPSKTFDVLKEDFDHMMIVIVLTGLIVGSYVTKYLASRKTLKQLWK
nr:ER membrane protein complex subunit 1 [Leptinotarsa decemlineata]